MHLRTFLRRSGPLAAAAWAITLAGVAFTAWVGDWVGVLALLVIFALSAYGEAQHQRATDAEAMRDDLAAERDRYLEQAIAYRLRLSVRNPAAHWED